MTTLFLYVCVGIGLIAGVFIYSRDPKWWLRGAIMLFKAALPYFLKALEPKDYTKDQLDRMNRGEQPGVAGQLKNDDGFHHK
jgi:hypothetical protein